MELWDVYDKAREKTGNRNFIELLFDMRKKYGAVKEFRP